MTVSDRTLSAAGFALAAVLAATPALAQQQTPAPADVRAAATVGSLNALEAERAQDQTRLEADLQTRRDDAFTAYARALRQGAAPDAARAAYMEELDAAQRDYSRQIDALTAEYADRRAMLRTQEDAAQQQ